MCRILFTLLVLVFPASAVFATPFAPSILRINAPQNIGYQFDGSNLNIPVTITGTPANLLFFVYTKDKASSIGPVKNGFLGWHYVNRIDTCMFWSGPYSMQQGSNALSWEGKDENGGIVPVGDYTYYMYAFNGYSPKQLVTAFASLNLTGTFLTDDSEGNPLAQPYIFSSINRSKWTIGADPQEASFLETTSAVGSGKPCFLPTDHRYFFLQASTEQVIRVAKYEWVPNGQSVLQANWGNDGYVNYDYVKMNWGDIAITGDILGVSWYEPFLGGAYSYLGIIDTSDGTQMRQIDLSDRWSSMDDFQAGAQMNGGPGQIVSQNGKFILSTFCDCYREMIDPFIEDRAEMVLWGNGNGDYVGDHNFETNSPLPWVCFDFNPAPYAYATSADANLFSSCGAYDLGAVSFTLFGPDGTGIGNFSFQGDTAGIKYGTWYLDCGSGYDGIYTDNNSTGTTDEARKGVWFIGHDSIKGVISNKSRVEVAAPAVFSVAQNTPNPFNPTTTISFILAKPGKTTVEVYNVAGQKVDTLVNGVMSAGSHSVIWNGAKFSAGVYFYTVKSGNLSKTMKMTLFK